jgi:hypothetical protein
MTITTSRRVLSRIDRSPSSGAPHGPILVSAWSQPCRMKAGDQLEAVDISNDKILGEFGVSPQVINSK